MAAPVWETLCRLCLTSRARLLPIFGGSEPADLAEKIKDCVAVQVKEDDELPTRVCSKCFDNVNNWYLFKKICEKSQAKLEVLSKENNQLSQPTHPIKIKSEPMTDENYDEGVIIDAAYPEYNQNDSSRIQPEGPPILASLGLAPRSEKSIVDPRLDWPRVEAILNLVQDDEVIDALQSAEELDDVHYSEHESDSEGDLISDVEDYYLDNKDGYITRDRRILARMPRLSLSTIKSKKRESVALKRIREIHQGIPPKNAWRKLITTEMLEYIVECSNDHIAHHSGSEELTSVKELEVLIGILYLHGVSRAFHHQRSELWTSNVGLQAVINVMEEKRFMYLLQHLRFEKGEIVNNNHYDPLKPIRTIFEKFSLNCRTSYEVGSHVVVDEKIEVIFGPCPFRTQLVHKPQHCGVKIFTLVDPSNFYVSNLNVVTENNSVFPGDCVKNLVEHLAGSGRTIIMDSWFTSIDLIQFLLKEYHLYVIAALKPSEVLIPPFFISQHRNIQTFMTAFVDSDIVLTSFVSSERKVINTLSSHPKFYKRSCVDNKNPVSVYKQLQSAGEVLNVLTKYYTTSQNTNSWALSLFFTMLDIASINAQVLWLTGRGDCVVRRNIFLRDIAFSLMKDRNAVNAQMNVQSRLRDSVKRPAHRVLHGEQRTRHRCRLCGRKKNRKTFVKCIRCALPICGEHSVCLCTNCGQDVAEN